MQESSSSPSPSSSPSSSSQAGKSLSLLLFMLDENRYAIPLASVERVYPAVEITGTDAVSDAKFLGFVNLHGELTPVVNIRGRFDLPAKVMQIGDMMIIVVDGEQKLAMIVDSIGEILEYQAEQMIIAESLLYTKAQVSVVSFASGIITCEEMRDYLTRFASRNSN